MRKLKYSDERLGEAVKNSDNLYAVMRYLGASTTSGKSRDLIKRRIIKMNLDTSHFRRPTDISADNTRLPWEKVLVYDRLCGRRENTFKLRRCMLEYGIINRCSCGQVPMWKGKELVLQIEHKDGNPLNNLPNNLEFLCPNCHSQTSTYCGRKKEKAVTKVE